MNGFVDQGLNEADFEEPKGISVKSFDAFRKSDVFHVVARALMSYAMTTISFHLVPASSRFEPPTKTPLL